MDPETKLFGTKRQLEEYTGYSGFTTAFLWDGLKRGTIKDQDIVRAVEMNPNTAVQLCIEAVYGSQVDLKDVTRKKFRKVRRLTNESRP